MKPSLPTSEVLRPTPSQLASQNQTLCSDSKVKKTNTKEVTEIDPSEVEEAAEVAVVVEVAEVPQEKVNKPEKVAKELAAEAVDNNS